jgi:hypothetical protein
MLNRELNEIKSHQLIPGGRFSRLKRDPDILMEQPG